MDIATGVFARTIMALALASSSSVCLLAQNTEAAILGTVKDSSGLAVAMAKVQLVNKGTGAQLSATTDNSGDFRFPAVDVGSYVLEIDAPGFQKTQFAQFDVLARESRRLDAVLKLATQSQSITVETSAGPAIQTDASNIAETKTGREPVDLPVAIATRGAGSASPISTLTTQPGVQTDQNGNISVAGGNPSQLSMTIDGVSVMGARAAQAGPIAELFPLFNAIEEIRVSEVINPAEFGGIADISTISKGGTNTYHGGVFENFQNSELNAANTFTHTAPRSR